MFFKLRYKDKSYIYLYKKLAKIQIKNLNMFSYLILNYLIINNYKSVFQILKNYVILLNKFIKQNILSPNYIKIN